jgi:hypothetical protein
MNKIIFYTLLLFTIRYFYSKYNLHLIKTDYDSKVKLLNNHIIYSNKPNIWILVPNDINSRKWDSFGSRTSKKLNVPFVNMCIDSIVKRCGNDFTINIIKDSSFSEFLPDWKYTVKHAPDIEKDKLRKLGLLKLVYYYGGLIVPCSFLCEKNLIDLYDRPISFETTNNSINNDKNLFLPTIEFFGSKKHNKFVEKLIKQYELEEDVITNKIGHLIKDNSTVIDGKFIGTKTKENKTVFIDDLFNNCDLIECGERYGVLLPLNDIINKSKYAWFSRMSVSQIKNSKLFISKVISK